MNRKIFFVAVALLAGTLVSCERENIPADFNNNGKVGVIVSGTEGIETKAGGSAEFLGSTLLEDIDGQDFRLDMYVEENNIMPFAEGVETKGSIVTTTSINKEGQKFAFNGWLGSTNRSDVDKDNYNFIPGATATKGASDWTLSEDYTWRNGVPSTFWSYYPTGTAGITLPDGKATDANQAKVVFAPTDVTGQQDILFAYNNQTVSYDINGKLDDGCSEFVNINFYHALAAIRFDISGAIADDVTITSVSFKDVVVDGSCAITGGAANSAGSLSPGAVLFKWTPGSTKKDLSQSVEASDFTEKGLGEDGKDKALMPLTSDKFLFVIPQDVKGLVKIGIVFTRTDGVSYTRTFDLTHDESWEAGKIYTYKLNPAADLIDVKVIETVDESTKTDVKVTNTGNLDEYVRVAIAGNWYATNSEGEKVLIKAWNFDPNDTAFDNFNTTDWTLKSSDGLLYSNNKLAPCDTVKLFDKFTAGIAPIAGATLDLYIIAQSVVAGKTNGWDAAVVATNN